MELNWGILLIQLFGGLAIFLYGMSVMTDGLKLVAGSGLKTFLAKMTSNRWKGLFAGASITAIIQSSSVTTVLVVGFVSAGLMSFENTLGIIFGANIGTTITAQIIAFKITEASLVFVAIGFLMNVLIKRKSLKDSGLILLGLGLVFLGMNIMSKGTSPLRDYEPFVNLMRGLDTPIWGILMGAAFTATIQSSSATTGIVIVMASQGLINIDGGIALVIGANIGTCITAILSALGKPRAAMQVAIAHVLFNVIGAVIWFAFIPSLASFVANISPNDVPRQIANAHTIFNIANTFIFIGFTKYLAILVSKIVPVEITPQTNIVELDRYFLKDVSIALELVHKNLNKLSHLLMDVAKSAPEIAIKGNAKDLQKLIQNDTIIDQGHDEILEYLGELQKQALTDEQMLDLSKQVEITNIIEMIRKLSSSVMVDAAELRLKKGFKMSKSTYKILIDVFNEAHKSLEESFDRFDKKEKLSLQTIEKAQKIFSKNLDKAHKHLVSKLMNDDKQRISIFRFETELFEIAGRMFELSSRIDRQTSDVS